jgi:microcystin-dependent protein
MANYEATRYDFDGANLVGIQGLNTGIIISWSDSSIPSGFLECDGTAVSRSTYATLFSVIGTTYGVGDGSTTFNLPNLQDNVPVGKSNNKSLASTGGANSVTPTGSTANATLSEAQLASHDHVTPVHPVPGADPDTAAIKAQNVGAANSPIFNNRNTGNAGSGSGHSHNLSVDAVSVLQPYLALIYIIKT